MKFVLCLRLMLAGMVILALAAFCAAQDPVENANAVCSQANLKDAVRVDGYIFRSYENHGNDRCFEVLRDGKILFRRTNDNGGWYKIGQPEDKEWKIPAIANGTDITGRSHPEMIVSSYTGGAHCCLFHYLFEVEPKFKLLATLDAEDDDLSHFEALDADGKYYYLTADWTFAYWYSSFAGSPSHSVVLHYVDDSHGGGFHLAFDKMQTPAPTPEEWQKALNDVRKELQLDRENKVNNLSDLLWQEVMDLIYSGHSDLAWKFLDEAGPLAQQKPYPDLAAFCSTLKTSPYWTDLAPTLKNTPPACANAKPDRANK
ncbi:MAG: hypothetical protein WB425_11450 [Terracidiphilus sp.]